MENQKKEIQIYLDELLRWNKTINLVSRKDTAFLYERHYLDSIAPLPYLPHGARVLDIGSGNGFPAIPISIHRKDLKVHAMETNLKKTVFLDHIKLLLNLKNFIVVKQEAGKLDTNKSKYDFVISRAFKNISKFIEIAVEYLEKNGTIIYFNSLNNNNLNKIQNETMRLINTVENIVYKSGDGIERILTIIRPH